MIPGKLLVLVPAFNEEYSVGAVVHQIHAALPHADVLVVDDGSTDRTAEEAAGAGAMVLPLPFNLGVGGAIRAGFRFALRHGYTVVVQVDADGQHDPAEVTRLLARLDPADVVVGARFAGRGEYTVRGPRRWAITLLAAVMSRIVGTRLTDVTSGFRAFNRSAVSVFARFLPVDYLGDTVESLVIASRLGLVVTQEPVRMRPRLGGQPSQRPIRAAAYLARAFVVLLLARIRRWPPVDSVGAAR